VQQVAEAHMVLLVYHQVLAGVCLQLLERRGGGSEIYGGEGFHDAPLGPP
jgi:hypothetical protein